MDKVFGLVVEEWSQVVEKLNTINIDPWEEEEEKKEGRKEGE